MTCPPDARLPFFSSLLDPLVQHILRLIVFETDWDDRREERKTREERKRRRLNEEGRM